MSKHMAKKIKILNEKQLAKKHIGSGRASDIIIPREKALWIPSRFLAYNYQTGGGLPYGKIMELFGEESSGKSLLATDFAYCTQQLGGIVLWADAEHSFDPYWMMQLGLDLDNIILYKETAVESISDWIADQVLYWRSKLTNNQPILLVVDSTAALDCLDNINSSQMDAKAEMGNRAKAIYKMFRIRNELLSDLGVASIWINQIRKKLGASKFEDPDTTPGGQALRFYASIRTGIYGSKQIKGKINGKETRVGRHVTIRAIKNKVAPPRETIKGAEVYTNYDYKHPVGFSKYFGIQEVLERVGVINRKKGASRIFLGDKPIARGSDHFLQVFREDGKLRKKLLRRAGINTISTTQKKIDKLENNLYPIEGVTFEAHEEKE